MSETPLTEEAVSFFALLVKADQKVLAIESKTVAAILENLDMATRDIMLNAYNKMLQNDGELDDKSGILKKIAKFDQEDKLFILRCLWRIAVSDDELGREEEKLIYEFIDAVNIDRRTAIAVQVSLD